MLHFCDPFVPGFILVLEKRIGFYTSKTPNECKKRQLSLDYSTRLKMTTAPLA